MSAIVGYRDKILQAAPVRNIAPAADAFLLLTADTPVFHVTLDSAGNPVSGTPAAINLTTTLFNLDGPVAWEVVSGAAVLTGTGNTRQLAYAGMTTDTATVRASTVYSGVTFQMDLIISKVRDGAEGVPGAPGPVGGSARIAFTLADGFALAFSPLTVAVEGDTRPITGSWGETRAWQAAIDSAPAANQAWFQSNGVYNSVADETVWSTPYLSGLKVGSLEALAVKTGDLEVSGTLSTASGLGFRAAMSGSNPDFVIWVGTGEVTEANGVFWLKKDGSGYFGGSLSAGTLRTAVTNPSLAPDVQLVNGPFGTNGAPINVVCSYQFTDSGQVRGATYATSGPDSSATIALYRTIAGAGESLVQTFSFTGATEIENTFVIDEKSSFTRTMGGSFTYTDTAGGVQNRTYRAVLTSRELQTINTIPTPGQTPVYDPVVTRQTLSIITTEG